MRRNATLSLDDLDPDVLDAARDVARRAGVPLETWLESVVGPQAKPPVDEQAPSRPSAPAAAEKRRRKRDASQETVSRPAPEPDAAPVAAALSEPVEPVQADAATAQERSGTAGASIGEMMQRLDGAPAQERKGSDGKGSDGKGSDEAVAEAIERPGTGTASAPEGAKPSDEMVGRLAEIERRMSEMNAELAGPRPLGRRGRPLAAEMRDAVEQIRQRQRELDEGGALPSPPAAAAEPSPAITDLQRETSRLRESLGSLATGRDVGALEDAMRTLASDVQRAREPGDLAAISAPIERIRGQVESLADEVADNVHSRISGEVARLVNKVEGALSSQPSSTADRGALDSVFRELDEIRRLIGSLAGPERIQGLAHGLQSISTQISELQGDMAGGTPAVDALKPLLEEIRRDLKAPDASKVILGRIDALADRMERAGVNPVGDLIGRLEDLGESLRRPAAQDGELANIQKMLRGLAEKVDHVGTGSGAESLDALEKQVVAIARRLDSRGADPAMAGLERMMKDMLGQVSAMREGNAVEAAVERATRRALAETMRSERSAPGTDGPGNGLEQLRAEFAELGARQAAADQRIQTTMGNLNAVLERLVERLGPAGEPIAAAAPATGPEERPLAERLSASASPAAMAMPARPEPAIDRIGEPLSEPVPQALRSPQPDAAPMIAPEAVQMSAPEAARLGDELLEPGAGRPRTAAPDQTKLGMPGLPGGDIKANFIAAARRAAQAAQADMETPAASARRSERVRGRISGETIPAAPVADASARNLVGRLRGEIDSRRRPLLLGLAAVVLVLGAYQAFDMGGSELAPVIAGKTPILQAPKVAEAPPAADAAPQGTAPPSAPAAPLQGQGAAQAHGHAPAVKPGPADPQTTQALADSAPPRPPAPSPAIPKVAGMDALKADLAGVPAPLSALRQAALDGEGAAVYELAARQADGRGVPRDLAIAVKLYEKLAASGFAPAQFKTGSVYEKGSGVIRDLDQAKLWYGRAAEQGNVRAMHNLAVLYAENPAAGGKPDFATASSWFRRAAEYGVRDSQYNLAVLYARGLGMNQDLIQSYGWFAAAAAQGDEEAAKKREDVAGKLSAKDLATAKGVVAAFKAKPAEPAANEVPTAKASVAAPMSLLAAPPPGAPTSGGFTPARPASRPAAAGV